MIVDILPNGQWVTLKKFRAPLRLGADVFSTGSIQPDTESELIQVFKKMAKLNKRYRAQKVITLATSAMRDAKNSRQIIINACFLYKKVINLAIRSEITVLV